MNIKRFFGKNSREALSMVRSALGDDAIILSNRQINGGNEIMAFREEDVPAAAAQGARHSMPAQAAGTRHSEVMMESLQNTGRANEREALGNERNAAAATAKESAELSADRHGRAQEPSAIPLITMLKQQNRIHPDLASASQPAPNHAVVESLVDSGTLRPNRGLAGGQAPFAKGAIPPDQALSSPAMSTSQISDMLNEMRTMRHAIESQLTTIAWANIQQREPAKASIMSLMIAAGFSPALSRYLAEKMPANLNEERAKVWMRGILAKNLHTIDSESTLLDQGGVFALIGPTGVGKTTTTAKLAARYVMKHGTHQLGLITTDAYRIGGHEQLRIYGKILGVMVHAVKDETDLQIALQELQNKHTILIDTVGVSQRDRMVAEQIAMLSNTRTPIKKLLCLNATSTGETLTDVIRAYQGRGLDGCIITKLDEAATIGNTLDVIIREKLRLYYIANGQRVPEDIHLANKGQLIDHALKLGSKKHSPFSYLHEELPFLMGDTVDHPSRPMEDLSMEGLYHV